MLLHIALSNVNIYIDLKKKIINVEININQDEEML